MINKVFNSLYEYGPDRKITSQIVERAIVSNHPKGKEVHIFLKPGIYFSSGKELQAEDVVSTVKVMLDKAYYYPYLSHIRFVENIHRKDKYEICLFSSHLPGAWQEEFTFKILNANQLKTASPETLYQTPLTGTGPYRIKEIKPGERVILTQNPFEKRCDTDLLYSQLEYHVVSYTQLVPLKLLKSEIDICELQPEHVNAYHSINSWQKKFSIIKYKKHGFSFLVFNLKKNRISKEVRQLIAVILCKTGFIENFLNGQGEPVNSPFFLENVPSKPVSELKPLAQHISMTLSTNSESKLRRNLVLFIAQALEKYNIHIEPLYLEYHTFLDYIKRNRFDLALSGFVMDNSSDSHNLFLSHSNFNYSGFEQAEMTNILKKVQLEPNPQKRRSLYLQAHQIWQEEMPILPLFRLYYFVGISRGIPIPKEKFQLIGSSTDFLFNIHQWNVSTLNL